MDDFSLISLVAYALIMFVAHLVQGVTGFGAMLLALPLLTFFFPVKEIIPAQVVVNLMQPLWYAGSQRRHIQFGHFRSAITLGLMGLPLGYAIYKYVPANELKITIGAFVVLVAVWNLSGLAPRVRAPMPVYHLLNFLGGAAQGSMTLGGPFFVIYAARMLEDKSQFRAGLSLIWTVLNGILVATHIIAGNLTGAMLPLILLAVPGVILGTAAGSSLHDRIAQEPFRKLVFVLLIISGLVLLRGVFSG